MTRAAARYRPPWWLPGGNAQTIYAALFAQKPRPRFARTEWTTPDDDRIVVDWLDSPAVDAAAPLVVLFHGLEGGSRSHYARALMGALGERGWRGAVPHFRGCGGVANRRLRAYHSGDTEEIAWLVRRFATEAHGAPLFAVGVSLGGNALLKWLGESGKAACALVRGAAAVCAPLDLNGAGAALSRGFNLVYTRHFLATLKPKALAKIRDHPGALDAERVRRARTMADFDDAVTAPLHGFSDYRDYWTRASAKPHLAGIAAPTLLVNARNDPFLPRHFLPESSLLSSAITVEFPEHGGHVGFVSGRFPGRLDWMPQRIIGFLESLLAAPHRPDESVPNRTSSGNLQGL